MSRTIFFGWRVVAAAFLIAVFSWGVSFYGPPIFLEVLHRTRGWPIPTVSAAITVHFLAGAALVANLSAIHLRLGLVRTTRLGAVLTGIGVLCWSAAREPWQLFPAAMVSGAGWALTSGTALNAMVAPWFVRRRPAALAMAFNGASAGGIVFSPLWVALISWLGFETAALAVAVVMVTTVWVVAGPYLSRDPASMGLAPDGETAGETASPGLPVEDATASRAPVTLPWRDRRFVTLAAAAALGLFAQIGLVAHLFSHLAPILGEAGAGATMGSVTAFAIGGRFLLGLMLPPSADRRLVAAANVGAQAIGSLLLLASGSSIPLLVLGCWLFGLGLGNVTSLPPLVAQAEFRRSDVPRVVSLVTAVSQAAYAFAPVAFGALLAAAGPGTGALALFAGAALVQASSAGMVLLGRGAPNRAEARASA